MRFLLSEHKAFKALIESTPLGYDTFSFVKKKGLLSISQEIMAEPFRFHRRDKSSLNDNGKWITSSSYSVNIGKEKMDLETFDGALTAFESWLAERQ